MQSGQDYDALQPTYSIWLLGEDLLRGDPCYAHRYRLRDERDRCLLDHGGIYLFELNKFAAEQVETEEQRWLKFFKDGEHLNADHLPVEATSGHDRASPGRATAAPNAAGGRSHRRPVRISRTSRPCRASRTTTASSSFPIAHG
uniref:PD-(D/E)XK nuclease family transposase n=1 Tax=Lamprocystis purpurea TaxID=61598 RepID=UPI002ADE66F2|nr:PD-(D/E)XK nuclease family transposase [Lamprocystis purpurea]